MAHNTSLGALCDSSCTGYYKDLHALDTLLKSLSQKMILPLKKQSRPYSIMNHLSNRSLISNLKKLPSLQQHVDSLKSQLDDQEKYSERHQSQIIICIKNIFKSNQINIFKNVPFNIKLFTVVPYLILLIMQTPLALPLFFFNSIFCVATKRST